jgi:hypothetical protein
MYQSPEPWPYFVPVTMTAAGMQLMETDILPVLKETFSNTWLEDDRAFYGHLSHALAAISRRLRVQPPQIEPDQVAQLLSNTNGSKSEVLRKAFSAAA